MTRTTNARVAGSAFLLYIAVGITQMLVFGGATAGQGTAAKLTNMVQHATDLRINIIFGLFTCFLALVLGVTQYSITREQDPELAMLSLVCRVGEGVIGAVFIPVTLGLLSLAAATEANPPNVLAVQALGALILNARSLYPIIGAIFFAIGSTFFSLLLLRGRMIPSALAWLGVFSSIVLVVGLPLQLVGVVQGAVPMLMWLPMAAFEIPLGLWLLIKGTTTNDLIS